MVRAGPDLYTVGPADGLQRFDLRPDVWRARLCGLVGRDLTVQEWATYVGVERQQRPVC